MALQKTLVLASGFTATDAYHRIVRVQIGEMEGVQVDTVVHFDVTKRNELAPNIAQKGYFFAFDIDEVLTASTVYAWAYGKLKTLSDFTGAVDV
jgi:hypothetical protein